MTASVDSAWENEAREVLGASASLIVLRGVVGILFGLAAFFVPGMTLAVLVTLFGLYALVDGVLSLFASVRMATQHRAWLALLFEGVVGIAAGIIAFRTPGLTAITLLYCVAAWAIITGVLEIVTAFSLREVIAGEWAQALGGVLSILLGYLLFAYPMVGIHTLVLMIGIYAVIYGVMMIVLGGNLGKLGSTS